jgi:O-antigen/teichoic acid export membrane protein
VVLSSALGLALMATAAMRLLWRLERSGEQVGRPMRLWIRYASVLYANGLFSATVQYLDRFIVGALIGAEGVATLVVARQLQQLPQTLFNMFLIVVGPMFASSRGQQLLSIYQITTDWCMRLALPLILFLVVFAAPMLDWYGRDFAENGTALLLLLLLATTINLAYGPIGNLLFMTGHESNMLRVTIAMTGAMILGYLILIPFFGLVGIGVAVTLSMVLGNGLAFHIARRRLGHVWWAARYTAWLLPAFLSLSTLLMLRAALGWSMGVQPIWLAVGLLLGYVSFGAGNLVFGIHADDRALLAAVMARLKSSAGYRG